MHRPRDGFTLIELLIVIVIIGILASIAIPRLGFARERAYFRAMVSDLRNLSTHQELYYALPVNNFSYAPSLAQFPEFQASNGVTIEIIETSPRGWVATATHAGIHGHQCGIVMGTEVTSPDFIPTPNVVTCTGN